MEQQTETSHAAMLNSCDYDLHFYALVQVTTSAKLANRSVSKFESKHGGSGGMCTAVTNKKEIYEQRRGDKISFNMPRHPESDTFSCSFVELISRGCFKRKPTQREGVRFHLVLQSQCSSLKWIVAITVKINRLIRKLVTHHLRIWICIILHKYIKGKTETYTSIDWKQQSSSLK